MSVLIHLLLHKMFDKIISFKNSNSDCLLLHRRLPSLKDGVYVISPDGTNGVAAYCDMASGGWTVSML